METFSVEKIMQEIREDIKNKGYTSDMLNFYDIDACEALPSEFNRSMYESILHNMKVYAYVPWYRDLSQSRMKSLVQKVIRKLISFVVAPIANQQSDFNNESTKEFEQIAGYIEQTEKQLEKNIQIIELLEERVEKLEAEIKKLREEKV